MVTSLAVVDSSRQDGESWKTGLASDGDPRLAVGLSRASRMLDVNVRTLWRYVQAGALPSFKIGRRRLIPVAAIRILLSEAEQRLPR